MPSHFYYFITLDSLNGKVRVFPRFSINLEPYRIYYLKEKNIMPESDSEDHPRTSLASFASSADVKVKILSRSSWSRSSESTQLSSLHNSKSQNFDSMKFENTHQNSTGIGLIKLLPINFRLTSD